MNEKSTNGSDSESNPINWTQHFKIQAGQLSPILIALSGSRSGMDLTLTTTINSLKDYHNRDLRLFVAAVMDTVQYPGSANGLTEHHNAVIGMLTANTGQTISLTANTPRENSFDWTVLASWQQATDYSWDVRDLRIIAWVQDYSNQEILQAGDMAF